jgi:hypothetical protein
VQIVKFGYNRGLAMVFSLKDVSLKKASISKKPLAKKALILHYIFLSLPEIRFEGPNK